MPGVMKYTRLGNSGLKVSRISMSLFYDHDQFSPWVHVIWDRYLGKVGSERGGIFTAAQGGLGRRNSNLGYR